MKDVVILVKHIECGGIASISIKVANMLANNGYNVSFYSVCRRTEKSPYVINKSVHFKELTQFDTDFLIKHNVVYRFHRKCVEYFSMKKLIKKTKNKCIITTLDEHNVLLSKFGNKESVKIAQVHHDHEFNKKQLKNFQKKYKNLDYVVTVADELTAEIREFLKGNSKAKVVTIYNFLQNKANDVDFGSKQNYVVAAGRFCEDKSFERLLEIWSEVVKVNNEWKLFLIGDGALRSKYEKIIEKNNIDNYVELTGFLSNEKTLRLFEKSKIYAMTSKTEAFSMTILESMSVKDAVIAFNVRFGPRTIISNPVKNGVLIKDNDMKSFCENLLKLMEDDNYREQISNAGYERVNDFFEDKILIEWKKILE